ncbi:unnamed protein product [Rhizopus stolonifer]
MQSTPESEDIRSFYSTGRYKRWTTPSLKSFGRQTVKLKRIDLIKQHHLPEFETQALCERCEKYVQTRVRYRNGSLVYLVSFILLLCTVVLCWIPFYVKYFKDVAHYCPGCGKKIGTHYKV